MFLFGYLVVLNKYQHDKLKYEDIDFLSNLNSKATRIVGCKMSAFDQHDDNHVQTYIYGYYRRSLNMDNINYILEVIMSVYVENK